VSAPLSSRPRLAVELRIMGALGLLWLATLLHALAWAQLAAPLDLHTAGMLVLAQLVALAVVTARAVIDLPMARWPRTPRAGPSPWWLALAGFPTLPAAPILFWRDARARRREPTPEAIDDAFGRLLAFPRTLGLRVVLWNGAASLVGAIVLGAESDLPRRVVLALALSWVGTLLAVAVLVKAWTRSIVRPEWLSAPRQATPFRHRTDLRLRLFTSGAIAALGLAIAPLSAGYVWLHSAARSDDARAELLGRDILDLAESAREEALGRKLAAHPGVTVRSGERTFGMRRSGDDDALTTMRGRIDSDGDGRLDLLVLGQGTHAVMVPLRAPAPSVHQILIVAGMVAFAAALAALAYLSRDTTRDVARATAQVDAVAKGEAPPPLTEGSFASAELRQLVHSVDRLVARITDANVAKYVAIERAKEADRLKSQFLANMSHDLRSPLNSVIGFSELLLTGIDGEVTDEQREMIAIIHQSGRDLLQQIDDILDTAKIEAGRLELHPEPTPPAALVTKGIQNARKRRPAALEIALDVAPGLPPAFVDPYRTVQAIENVLVFASERMEKGTIDVTVRQGHSGRRKTIAIGVRTPVRPATAEQLTRARRGFHRIPGHKGLGLGLPIAGSIVELQGGSVSIEDLGEGMVFTLHLRALETRRTLSRQTRDELDG
jgi:signal transduction histidine kinase